jgi:hypothetical protein
MDWEEFRCPIKSPVSISDTQAPIHATVHAEPSDDAQTLVTVALFPPDGVTGADDVFSASATAIARDLQQRLAETAVAPTTPPVDPAVARYLGQHCATSADCGPLRCVSEQCVDPYGRVSSSTAAAAEARRGGAGESCRVNADCEMPLECGHGVCTTEQTSSERLMKTTKQIARWGAYLSIPPICAIGVLVLLTCLFMVIVAGCLYAGGD